MKRQLRGVLVDPYTQTAKDFTFDLSSYRDFYPVLDCDTFDIVDRKFGKNTYSIYLDDNGLLEGKPTAIYTLDDKDDIVEELVGKCFICKHNKNGDVMSLTENQVKEVLSSKISKFMVCRV